MCIKHLDTRHALYMAFARILLVTACVVGRLPTAYVMDAVCHLLQTYVSNAARTVYVF